jgi:ELWxxDGT repeat protein
VALTTGSGNANPNGFHVFNSKVYFSALRNSSISKYELYSFDGTPTGFISYPTMRHGTGSASPRLLTTFGNMLVFSARPSVAGNPTPFYGEEIMGFDGNPWTGGGGAQIMLKDINTTGSSSPNHYTVLNNLLLFVADDGVNGRELWVSNGTNAGTNLLFDVNSGGADSNPEDLIVLNNKLYFTADDGVSGGRELWISDGTVAGTQPMKNLNAIADDLDNPENLTVFNNALYFTATHPALGTEIFKLGGTSITNLKNIASGSNHSNPSNLFVSTSRLYFSADNGVNGRELWSSTGFSATTNMVKDINVSPSSPDSNPEGFTEYNGKVYFSATDDTNGIELWVTDGTSAGTNMLSNINPSGDSNPTDLIVANNLLFFSANNGSQGIELWKYQDQLLSVNNLELENKFSLYPNPTSNSFFIESNIQLAKVSISNLQGKTIKTFNKNMETYNVEDLTSGLYFINIQTEKGKITKKLIKQ